MVGDHSGNIGVGYYKVGDAVCLRLGKGKLAGAILHSLGHPAGGIVAVQVNVLCEGYIKAGGISPYQSFGIHAVELSLGLVGLADYHKAGILFGYFPLAVGIRYPHLGDDVIAI